MTSESFISDSTAPFQDLTISFSDLFFQLAHTNNHYFRDLVLDDKREAILSRILRNWEGSLGASDMQVDFNQFSLGQRVHVLYRIQQSKLVLRRRDSSITADAFPVTFHVKDATKESSFTVRCKPTSYEPGNVTLSDPFLTQYPNKSFWSDQYTLFTDCDTEFLLCVEIARRLAIDESKRDVYEFLCVAIGVCMLKDMVSRLNPKHTQSLISEFFCVDGRFHILSGVERIEGFRNLVIAYHEYFPDLFESKGAFEKHCSTLLNQFYPQQSED